MSSKKGLVAIKNASVLAFAGWSGSGKTTLLERLIPEIVQRGLRVAVIKHHGHNDAPADDRASEKDSERLIAAGAGPVVLLTGERMIWYEKARGDMLADVLSRLKEYDFVLLEGFKDRSLPKVEVRPADASSLHTPRLAPSDPNVLAIVTAEEPREDEKHCLHFRHQEIKRLAAWVIRYFSFETASDSK